LRRQVCRHLHIGLLQYWLKLLIGLLNLLMLLQYWLKLLRLPHLHWRTELLSSIDFIWVK